MFNPLNAELNPICHLLALVGAHHTLHVNRVRVKSPLSTVWGFGKWQLDVTEGWVENFKKRVSLYGEKRIGESASAEHVGGADYPELVKRTIEMDHLPEMYSGDGGVMALYTDVYKDMQEMARQCSKTFCFAKSFASPPLCIPFRHSDKFQPETPTFLFQKSKEIRLILFFLSCFLWFP